MAIVGMNVDPLNASGAPSPADLKQAGFTWVRLVSRPGVEGYVAQCRAAGVRVLAVLAQESFQGEAPHLLDPAPDAYQLGNEPDGAGESSWKLSREEYVNLWNALAGGLGERVIAAGLCSDDSFGWIQAIFDELVPAPEAIAVHPYGATPEEAQNLLDEFSSRGVPVWLTEWNLVPRQPLDGDGVASELAALWAVLNASADAAFWFCWSDKMVDGLGVFGKDDQPKPFYQDLVATLTAQDRQQ
jgi:hypothetical protein